MMTRTLQMMMMMMMTKVPAAAVSSSIARHSPSSFSPMAERAPSIAADRSPSIVPPTSFKWLLLLAVVLANFGEAFNTGTLSIMTVNIKQRYKVDNEALGTLFAIRKLVTIFTPLISGAFVRRFGFAPVLLSGVAMLLSGTLFMLVSIRMNMGFVSLSAGFVLATGFFSFAQVAAYTGFAKLFRGGSLAFAFSLDYAAYLFGGALCGFVAPSLVNLITNDFSSAFAVSGGAIFCSFLMCIAVLFKAPVFADDNRAGPCDQILDGYAAIGKLTRIGYVLIAFSLVWLSVIDNIKYFSSDYLQTRLSVDMTTASRLYSLTGLAAAVSGPLLGVVFDRIGRLPFALLFSSVLLVPPSVVYLFHAQLGLVNSPAHMASLISAIVVMSVVEASQATLKQVMLVRTLPASHFAVLQGLVIALTNGFTGLSLFVMGVLSRNDPTYTGASILTESLVCVLLLLSVFVYVFDAANGSPLAVPSALETPTADKHADDTGSARRAPSIDDSGAPVHDEESEAAPLVYEDSGTRVSSRHSRA